MARREARAPRASGAIRAIVVLAVIVISVILMVIVHRQAQTSEVLQELCERNARELQSQPKPLPGTNPEVAMLLLMLCDYSGQPPLAK